MKLEHIMGRPMGMPIKMLELIAEANPEAKAMVRMLRNGMSLDEKRRIVCQMQIDQIMKPRKKGA